MERTPLFGGPGPRRRVAIAAVAVGVAFLVLFRVTAGGWMDFMARCPLVCALLIALVISACNAVIIVELLRILIRSATWWSNRKHFGIVAIVWAILLAMQTGSLLVWRQSIAGR